MDQGRSSGESCPLGAERCPYIAEIERLREECRALAELSQTDPLTGLYNFRYFIAALEKEMERTRRTGLPTGLIMIDLDRFKSVNDTYGHQAGNRVLTWAGKVWKDNLRRIDIPCRYGGEEFAIILPGIRLGQAVAAAERLRASLSAVPVLLDGHSVTVTASFGVDVYGAKENLPADDFIKKADRFLRDAKAKGRNCVCYEESKLAHVPSQVTREERAALFIGRWPKT